MAGGKHILGKAKRHIFGTARVGEKGQIVIPKEARQIFGVQPGDTLLILGDEETGIIVTKPDVLREAANGIFGWPIFKSRAFFGTNPSEASPPSPSPQQERHRQSMQKNRAKIDFLNKVNIETNSAQIRSAPRREKFALPLAGKLPAISKSKKFFLFADKFLCLAQSLRKFFAGGYGNFKALFVFLEIFKHRRL